MSWTFIDSAEDWDEAWRIAARFKELSRKVRGIDRKITVRHKGGVYYAYWWDPAAVPDKSEES